MLPMRIPVPRRLICVRCRRKHGFLGESSVVLTKWIVSWVGAFCSSRGVGRHEGKRVNGLASPSGRPAGGLPGCLHSPADRLPDCLTVCLAGFPAIWLSTRLARLSERVRQPAGSRTGRTSAACSLWQHSAGKHESHFTSQSGRRSSGGFCLSFQVDSAAAWPFGDIARVLGALDIWPGALKLCNQENASSWGAFDFGACLDSMVPTFVAMMKFELQDMITIRSERPHLGSPGNGSCGNRSAGSSL